MRAVTKPVETIAENAPPRDERAVFVLRLARALHSYGAPAHRLGQAVEQVAQRMGLHAVVFSLPTAIFASFDRDGHGTHLLRVKPSPVNLERLLALDRLADEAADEECTPAEALDRLDSIVARRPMYVAPLVILATAFYAAGAARFFGGGLLDCCTSFLVGMLIAGIARVDNPVVPLVAAAAASFIATALGDISGGIVSGFVVTMAALVVLMPGLSLTIAMNELATGHVMCGTGRLMSALIVFLELGFGVLLGAELANAMPALDIAIRGMPLPSWTGVASIVVVAASLIVRLQAPWREALPILVGVSVALAGARSGAITLGPEIGAAVAAFAVGMLSNLYSRTRHRPVVLMLVPAVLVLVPGSIGFRGFSSMFEEVSLASIETAVTMFLIATAIVVGLLAANAVVSPKRAL